MSVVRAARSVQKRLGRVEDFVTERALGAPEVVIKRRLGDIERVCEFRAGLDPGRLEEPASVRQFEHLLLSRRELVPEHCPQVLWAVRRPLSGAACDEFQRPTCVPDSVEVRSDSRCTHEDQRFDTGRGVPMREGEIVCPRHGSLFDACEGDCDSGETAGTTLPAVTLAERHGTVVLTDDGYEFVHEGGIDNDEGPSSLSYRQL